MAAARRGGAASERWLTRIAAAIACGVVALLFWSLSSGMQQSSCRSAISTNPDCINPGPSARVLLAWSTLGVMGFAAALVLRRLLRRRRMVREGMNFVASTSERVLRGERMLRWAGHSCWAVAAFVALALAISGAGIPLLLVGAGFALVALVLWLSGLRLRHR